MGEIMKIVHLSDIHYQKKYFEDYYKLFEAMTEDLKNNINDFCDCIIVITGDLIDKDNQAIVKNGLQESVEFITTMASTLGIPTSRIFISPGNHEIEYKVYIPDKFIQSLDDDDQRNKIINEIYDAAQPLNSDNLNHIKSYYDFITEFNQSSNYLDSNFSLESIYKINDIKNDNKDIVVASLNNVWRYLGPDKSKQTYGKMSYGLRQLDTVRNKCSKSTYNIGISHYPFSFICESEKNYAEKMAMSNFSIFLCGHAHNSNNHFMSGPGDKSNAGCVFNYGGNLNMSNVHVDTLKYSLGYDLISTNGNNVIINHRKYNYTTEKFIINSDLGENGLSTYEITNTNTEQIFEFRDALYQQLSEFDGLLLSNTIPTQAPKTVNDFVLELSLRKFDSPNKESDYLNISDIIKSNLDYCIFAKKETGKSTLLYGIFNLLLKNSLIHGRYPIYIDIAKKRENLSFENYVNSNYRIGKTENMIKFFRNVNLTILIDNIDVSNKKLVEELINFKDKLPDSHIICTSIASVSGKLPLKFAECGLNHLVALELLPMNEKQINEFSKKWFNGDFEDRKDEIDSIVKTITKKKITPYPLFVGMFFWLVEERKSIKRIDHNIIIENFVEKLLEKTEMEKNTLDSFSFRNRMELLGQIAEKVVVENEGSPLNSTQFNECLSSFLNEKRFSNVYKVRDLEDYLFKSNIFSRSGDKEQFISFRYHSVLNYFIAYQMEFKSEFKDYILKKEILLKFIEALDIFSSKHRNELDLFALSSDVLRGLFNKLKSSSPTLLEIDQFYKRTKSIIPIIQANLSDSKASEELRLRQEEKINEQLKNIETVNEIEQDFSNKKMEDLEALERAIVLHSYLVRNSENITDLELKVDSINLVIDSSIYFVHHYFLSIKKSFEENHDMDLFNYFLAFSLFGPLVINLLLNETMASIKLHDYIVELDKRLSSNSLEMSEYKKYVIEFFKFENAVSYPYALKELEKYFATIDNVFIRDNIYAKLNILKLDKTDIIDPTELDKYILRIEMENKNYMQKALIDKEHKKKSNEQK